MTWLFVAGALGAIIITGGLFLRRLLGELAALRSQLTEQRRQITGIDRQLRAQRARVDILRQLIADEGDPDHGDGSHPPQAAVVNGIDPAPSAEPDGPEPVRRKRHLGLYIGGAAAALAAISGAAREAARGHRMQIVGAVTGAAVTAATVTIVTVQPFTHDTGYEPPHAEPPATAPPTYVPPGPRRPTRPPGSPPPISSTPSPSASPAGPSVSPSPSTAAPSRPERAPSIPALPIAPAGDQAPAGGTAPAAPDGRAPDDTSGEADDPPPASSTGPSPDPTQPPTEPPAKPPPVAEQPADSDSGLCVDVSVPPLVDADACVLR